MTIGVPRLPARLRLLTGVATPGVVIPGVVTTVLASVLWTSAAVAQTAAETEHEGMPQLDFSTPLTISQVVWMAIIFLTMYVLLSKWALPQVAAVVESRAASIASDLEAARTARTGSEAAAAEVAAATRQAHTEAQAQIASAVTEAKAAVATETERSNVVLEAQLQAAEARIGEARVAALGALRQVASETAAMVYDRLTGTHADPGRLDTAVDAALAARRA